MRKNNRTKERRPFQKECILFNEIGLIEAQTVDISIMGLGVKADSTLPFKIGYQLTAFIPNMKAYQAKLIWIEKDINKTTRLGLKFVPA